MTADVWDVVAARELELATLEAELEAFHGDYLRALGALIAEVHELQARLADLEGDRAAAAAAHEQAQRSAADMRAVPPPAPPPPPPDEDLKALFRRAAKRMHPDLAPDDAGRAHAEAFMKRLNEAYRAGDTAGIADLLRQWEGAPHAPADPARDAVAADAALDAVERRLREARESDMNKLMEQALAAALRGEDLLADLRAQWQRALADVRARLDAATRG